ncbi:hypothetical protein ABH908_000531 [Pseudomonas frederiksbergensis]|uniref:UvrD-helicase domain-containing protein n=1 Tax=Pseudomonas TaxID=286 RepID=UPI003D25F47A
MNWTHEQYPVITSLARLIRVQAFAGTGKTSTLVGYAQHHYEEKILYIAYNTSVAEAAKRRFPDNVTCTTSHSLAFGPMGSRYQHKRADNLRLTDVARAMRTRNWEMVKDVVGTINAFLCSIDTEINAIHFPRFKGPRNSRQQAQVNEVVIHATNMWQKMIDINDSELPMIHDGYLKLWLLSEPNLSRKFGTIMLDEGQDTNKVMTAFVRAQYLLGCKVLIVGDRHQQLYRFRGAENALEEPWLREAEDHFLTQSWRFGFGAAHVANAILALKGERRTLQGFGPQTKIKSSLPDGLEHRTYLCRTLAGVIDRALSCLPNPADKSSTRPAEKLYWVGGIKGYQLQSILDLYWFSSKQLDRIKGYQLTKDYADFATYREIADATSDNEMMRSIKILDSYGSSLPDLIKSLEACTVVDELEATVTLSTGHKSKGLEWSAVQLGDDFTFDPLAEDAKKDPAKFDDEVNLLYVMATRGMDYIALNPTVISIMQHAKDLRERRA